MGSRSPDQEALETGWQIIISACGAINHPQRMGALESYLAEAHRATLWVVRLLFKRPPDHPASSRGTSFATPEVREFTAKPPVLSAIVFFTTRFPLTALWASIIPPAPTMSFRRRLTSRSTACVFPGRSPAACRLEAGC